MKRYKLFFYRNLLLLTLLFGIGHQMLTSSYLDTFAAKHLKVNLAENIYGTEIESQDFDQNIPSNQMALIKKFISRNLIQMNSAFLLKISLNTWKPPKILVI